MSIETMLTGLAALMDKLALLELRFQELSEQAVPPEVRATLADIEAEKESTLAPLRAAIDVQTQRVKEAVLALGQSSKSAGLTAVYTKPRITWNSKALDGYAAAHPEIRAFRKVGKASVSIRVNPHPD